MTNDDKRRFWAVTSHICTVSWPLMLYQHSIFAMLIILFVLNQADFDIIHPNSAIYICKLVIKNDVLSVILVSLLTWFTSSVSGFISLNSQDGNNQTEAAYSVLWVDHVWNCEGFDTITVDDIIL